MGVYSGFPKVVARKGLKNARFPKVVAFAQPKLVAQSKAVAFSAQLLLETHYNIVTIYKKNKVVKIEHAAHVIFWTAKKEVVLIIIKYCFS